MQTYNNYLRNSPTANFNQSSPAKPETTLSPQARPLSTLSGEAGDHSVRVADTTLHSLNALPKAKR